MNIKASKKRILPLKRRPPSPNRSSAWPRHAPRFPTKLAVQLATLVKEPPAGEDCLHEVKFDGYRMLCRIENAVH
jgi:bifunctional non-homologous end joining protein LigD